MEELQQEKKIDLIVLAGFTLKIPEKLVKKYERRIINLHPSLLPKFGGKGMYGDRVHMAVLKSKEEFTGITIHYVDEVYDNGEVIFQKRCNLHIVLVAINPLCRGDCAVPQTRGNSSVF